MSLKTEIPERVIELTYTISLSLLGGMAHYLYDISKGAVFKFWLFIANLFLSGFVGVLIGDLIPNDSQYKNAMIAMGAFSAMRLLDFFEEKGLSLLIRFLKFTIMDKSQKDYEGKTQPLLPPKE